MNPQQHGCGGDVRRYPNASFDCYVSELPHGELSISIRGEVDSVTAPVLDTFLARQLAAVPRFAGVEVVLTNITFLGARGIGALLNAAQEARRRHVDFCVVGCSEWLLRVFGIAGVRDVLAASD